MIIKHFYNDERKNLPEDLKKDFEFLILEKLKISRMDLKSETLKVDEVVLRNLKSGLEELKSGKPLAYILKSQFFLGYEFYVDHRVLIPRSETEYMVDFVLKSMQHSNQLVLDAGAGSGCIGISILLQRPNSKCIFVENSKAAIEVIKINLEKFKIVPERYFILDDINHINQALVDININKLDLFISNPPYIASHDPEVQDSVLKYEPHSALFCEDDGLKYLKDWSLLSIKHLNPSGLSIFEFGHGQENFLQSFAIKNKIKSEIINDQYDRPRFWKITSLG